MVNHPNRSKRDSKRSAALLEFIEQFDLRRVGTIADGDVVIYSYVGAKGRKVLTVDMGDDGWDVYVPVSPENKVSATKDALTAYLGEEDPIRTALEAALNALTRMSVYKHVAVDVSGRDETNACMQDGFAQMKAAEDKVRTALGRATERKA